MSARRALNAPAKEEPMRMFHVSRSAFGLAAAVLLMAATAATAQQPTRIRGEIEKADGPALVVKTRDGATLHVKLADDARVSALVKASLADIKNDTFIGIAGMPRPDGSIEAFSIHIFLPAQRGVVPDRHGPWDARPGSTMTNAYVESMVEAKDGETLTVKYKDGEKKIVVQPATVITAVAAGDKSELKAGTPVIIMASDKQPDGSVLAKTLYVGRGVAPAM
jgi:outer membrane lipoprotein SlyB